MTIFYTSDSHFGHENVIRYCARPFKDVDEMNRALIDRWNAKVAETDDVYVLGDFAFRCKTSPLSIIRNLNGRKHLVIGNHDHTRMKDAAALTAFVEAEPLLEVADEDRRVTLCHYPMMHWRNSGRGFSWHVHGRIHNRTDDESWRLLRNMERALNAGVDVNHFEPVTLDELLANNIAWKGAH